MRHGVLAQGGRDRAIQVVPGLQAVEVLLHAIRKRVIGRGHADPAGAATARRQNFGLHHGDDGRAGQKALVVVPHIGAVTQLGVDDGDLLQTLAQRIAEVSGAAVGSIYQYFPNKDAIVAMLYERVLDQESEQLLVMRERLAGVPLAAALRETLANIIRIELRLFKLNRPFICATTRPCIWAYGAARTAQRVNLLKRLGCRYCRCMRMKSTHPIAHWRPICSDRDCAA